MRAHWNRAIPTIALDVAGAAALLAPAFPGRKVAHLALIAGGMQNSNFRVEFADGPRPVVLRLYQHDRARADKEAALAAAFGPRIRAPRILWRTAANPVTGHACAVLEWVDGVQLDRAFAAATAAGRAALGHAAGVALAGVHAIGFARAGFLAGDLTVAQPMTADRDGLAAFLRASLLDGRGATRIAPGLAAALLDLAGREGARLDAWPGGPSLVHADFGGTNILVRGGGTSWDVAGIVDWEFALSGTPAFDFGNLLRPPFGDDDGFVRGLADSYRAAGGTLPGDWRRIGLLADLFNWAEFMARERIHDGAIESARARFAATLAAFPMAPPPASR